MEIGTSELTQNAEFISDGLIVSGGLLVQVLVCGAPRMYALIQLPYTCIINLRFQVLAYEVSPLGTVGHPRCRALGTRYPSGLACWLSS